MVLVTIVLFEAVYRGPKLSVHESLTLITKQLNDRNQAKGQAKAKSKAEAKGKAEAKAKGQAKAKSKAIPTISKKTRPGCSKCRYLAKGCAKCR